MRGFKLYKIDNFDGDNAICSLNRDLERMGRKYMSCKDKESTFARELAAQIRAKTLIVSDIIG